MDYYIDIQVLPDHEFGETILMSALFSKLHCALVALGYGSIGVSFPKAGKMPGNLLRLHGDAASLESLMMLNWLKGLADYTKISNVSSVPNVVEYVQVKRVQPKHTAAKLRRSVKRGSLSEAEAEELLSRQKMLKQPFFQLSSQSTGQKYPLFISQVVAEGNTTDEGFNSYGLSTGATVPFFNH